MNPTHTDREKEERDVMYSIQRNENDQEEGRSCSRNGKGDILLPQQRQPAGPVKRLSHHARRTGRGNKENNERETVYVPLQHSTSIAPLSCPISHYATVLTTSYQ
mmetsp:Transcript_39347/g.44016  ORF Transcript_39347/g.44016 Transcript_39347/m.44016 type:complete len:105 (-) Transcript_39347:446-760(-)